MPDTTYQATLSVTYVTENYRIGLDRCYSAGDPWTSRVGVPTPLQANSSGTEVLLTVSQTQRETFSIQGWLNLQLQGPGMQKAEITFTFKICTWAGPHSSNQAGQGSVALNRGLKMPDMTFRGRKTMSSSFAIDEM